MTLIRKSSLLFLYDLLASSFSFLIACLFRFSIEDFSLIENTVAVSVITNGILAIALLSYFKINRVVVRYFSLINAVKVFNFSCYFITLSWITLFILTRLEVIPRTILVLHLIILNILLLAPRVLVRLLRDYQTKSRLISNNDNKIQVLLIGVNPNTEIFIRNLVNNKNSEYQVVGIIDDKISRYGNFIHNIPIIGDITMLAQLLPKLKQKRILPQKLIVTEHNITDERLSYYLEIAEKLGLTIARSPKITDFKNNITEPVEFQPIIIEDLLGRPQAIAATSEINAIINHKVILVTGGAGTIGSELLRQLIIYNPQKIIVVDSSEFNLYQISQELTHYGNLLEFKIGDVRNQLFIDHILTEFKVQLIFHAAAIKHVPIAEDNPIEAVTTNFNGTKNICDAAIVNNVEAVILISTDKAVNPTNIMGTSKRLAEHYVNYCSNKNTNTKFITVRFGNVLGSSGSVIPLFKKQIMQGGPITLTHPEIKRFFMTVREAVTLVLNAITIGCVEPNHHNGIFILNMGKSIRIYDLAVRMIKLAGLTPERDIEILITGLRPGEKLIEELFYEHEKPVATKHQDLMFSNFNSSNIITEQFCQFLAQYCNHYNYHGLLNFIQNNVAEYNQIKAELRIESK